jgi:hypothetical protein
LGQQLEQVELEHQVFQQEEYLVYCQKEVCCQQVAYYQKEVVEEELKQDYVPPLLLLAFLVKF